MYETINGLPRSICEKFPFLSTNKAGFFLIFGKFLIKVFFFAYYILIFHFIILFKRSLITPQWIINSLPHYTIRNGAYTTIDNFCGICYSKYNVGDRAICLPCHHTVSQSFCILLNFLNYLLFF